MWQFYCRKILSLRILIERNKVAFIGDIRFFLFMKDFS